MKITGTNRTHLTILTQSSSRLLVLRREESPRNELDDHFATPLRSHKQTPLDHPFAAPPRLRQSNSLEDAIGLDRKGNQDESTEISDNDKEEDGAYPNEDKPWELWRRATDYRAM